MATNRYDKPVVLSHIYTRAGDDGTTALGDASRTEKTDPRLAAYADVDEANCAIGTALALSDIDTEAADVLTRLQNELFDVGADLATPVTTESENPPLRVDQCYIDALEADCDRFNAGLPTLRSFVLPGGSTAAALLHTARAVVRRAERSGWAAVRAYGDGVNSYAIAYLNRLSDLLFILARRANSGHGDVLWRPGGQR